MRVLIVTHYFPPEVAVPATRLHELGLRLVERGHTVSVIAPWPHHPTGVVPPRYRRRPFVWEHLDGMRVLRTWVLARPNEGAARLFDQLSFAVVASLAAFATGPCDVVVSISPPIFLGATGALVARAKLAASVLYIGDLWVESAVEIGALENRWAFRLADIFARATYRWASSLLVVTQGIRQRLLAVGVPSDKVHVLTNGVDTTFIRPVPEGATVRRSLGLESAFVALYAGTHGMAHGLDVVLDAAERLKARPDVQFVLVGEGAEKARLVHRAEQMGLTNVRFLPNQPRERMPEMLSCADVCLVPLRDLPIFRGALPTKMLEAMAAARPVILSVAGEAADALEASGGGIVVPPDDSGSLAAAILYLAADRARGTAMGLAGRTWVQQHFDRDGLAGRFEQILTEVAARR